MQRVAIRIGIDRHGGDAHFARGFDDATGDFATVGNQNFFEHGFTFLPFGPSWPSVSNKKPRAGRFPTRGDLNFYVLRWVSGGTAPHRHKAHRLLRRQWRLWQCRHPR